MTIFNAHQDSVKPQKAFVAIFDVLGFKERIKTTQLTDLIDQYRRLELAKRQAGVVTVLSSSGSHGWQVGTTVFSDTFLFWANDTWEDAQTLVSAATHLLESALALSWPLRGAIAYGECVLDRRTRTFIGRPIVDAYETEQSQEWLGAALHPSVAAHPLYGSSLLKLEEVTPYQVPVKQNSAPLTHALHWGPHAMSAVSRLREMQANTTCPRVQLKYEHSIQYVLATCKGTHAVS